MIITYLELAGYDVNTNGELIPFYDVIIYCPMPIVEEPFDLETFVDF